jgi:type IV secretory pathway VirB10-like protein
MTESFGSSLMKVAGLFISNQSLFSNQSRGDVRPRVCIAGVTRWAWIALLILACAAVAQAQDVQPPPANPSAPDAANPEALPSSKSDSISLTVPKGTPVEVVLDQEVRLRKVGQPIHARVAEPVYAFDKLVIPVGAEVTGTITKIQDVSRGKRTAAALDADFTPSHKIDVAFDEMILPGGQRLPVRTSVTPGSGQVIQFVTASEEKKSARDAAAEKTKKAKEEAKREWNEAMQQVKKPGKMHRLEKFAVAQLPFHPQYIDAGTVYFAELLEPLDFGSEPLTPEIALALSSPPPDGSTVHARLLTPLSSATTQKGEDVEAMVTQPLFDAGRLIIPQGSLLKGSIVQVEPARSMSRSGQLRFVFHNLVLPMGLDQRVDAILAGIEAGKAENLRLDSEGGAQAAVPNSRYITTGIVSALAALSFGVGGDTLGDAPERAAGGAGGYKLIGIALGLSIHSQPFGMAMGAFGASRSIYVHFIARGRDVVFPRDTAMEISIGTHAPSPSARKPAQQ